MIEVGVAKVTRRTNEFKREKKLIRDAISRTPAGQAGELWSEYAEKCEALGHEYSQQQGCEIPAKSEFGRAAEARQYAAYNYHNIQ